VNELMSANWLSHKFICGIFKTWFNLSEQALDNYKISR
jgi:hypothetical protein